MGVRCRRTTYLPDSAWADANLAGLALPRTIQIKVNPPNGLPYPFNQFSNNFWIVWRSVSGSIVATCRVYLSKILAGPHKYMGSSWLYTSLGRPVDICLHLLLRGPSPWPCLVEFVVGLPDICILLHTGRLISPGRGLTMPNFRSPPLMSHGCV